MRRDHRVQLEQKRRELEVGLQDWAAKNNILKAGERLKFHLCVEKIPEVVGSVTVPLEPRPIEEIKLPRDETSAGCKKTWNLTEEDWKRLATAPWEENQAKLLALLQSHNNGPLHISKIIDGGIVWEKRKFRHRFNSVIRRDVDDYRGGKGSYYRLETPRQGSEYWAIMKYGYF